VFLHVVNLTKEYNTTGRLEYILMLPFNKNEMGGACSTYEVYSRFWWGNMRVRDHLEDPGVDGRIIGSSGSGM
jgi:hypothetical protein